MLTELEMTNGHQLQGLHQLRGIPVLSQGELLVSQGNKKNDKSLSL
jgi:hypothetical protein